MAPTYGSGDYGSGPYSGTTYAADLAAVSCGPILLLEVDFPTGTSYFAVDTARFVERIYDGKVLTLGSLRRAIQQNLGIFEVSELQALIADADRALIAKAASTIVKGTAARLKLGTRRIPLSDFTTIHQGKIDDFGAEGFGFRIVIKDNLWTLPPFPDTGTVNTTDFPNALPADVGKPLPLCYGSHTDTGTDDARNRGAWPMLFVDVRTSERVFLIARHAVKDIAEVYAFKPSAGSQLLDETTDYVAYPNGTLIGKTMAFIKLTSTGFGKLQEGNALGILTANIQGKETTGDTLGDLITNPIEVLKDLLSNFLGNPSINAVKFAEASLVSQTRGYVVRGGYFATKGSDILLKEFCNSFNIRIFPDTLGRIAVDIYEPSGPHDVVQSINESFTILENSMVVDFVSGLQGAEDAQIVNHVDYEYGFHHAKAFFSGSNSVEDATSLATYGSKRLTASLPWAGNSGTARDVAYRIIILYRNPVDHITVRVPLMGMLIDLTDQVAITHKDGPPSGGYVATPFDVIEHQFNPDNFSVNMRMRNVDTISGAGYFFDDEAARTRVSNGTVAVVNGSAQINSTGATSFITAGVQVGDIIRLKTVTNSGNRLNLKVTAIIDADTIETAQTVWTNESGIGYDIIPSWLTATADQKLYGHLASVATGQFSNADAGFVLI